MAKQEPLLSVGPERFIEGTMLVVRGSGWPDCPVAIEVDGKPVALEGIALGTASGQGLHPDPRGEFVAYVWSRDWKAGQHELRALSEHVDLAPVAMTVTTVERPLVRVEEEGDARTKQRDDGKHPEPHQGEVDPRRQPDQGVDAKRPGDEGREPRKGGADEGPEPADMPYARRKWQFDRLGFIPPTLPLQQIRELRGLGGAQPKLPNFGGVTTPLSIIVEGACNWTPVFAGPAVVELETGHSGRVNAIALDPVVSGTAYIGTSSGGVWKTIDSGATWHPMSDYQGSLRISSVAIDPNNRLRVFAGTGDGGYPGIGLLHSEDGGESWTEDGAATLAGSNIYRIRFDPADTLHHLFVATSHGIYETTDGTMWTQLRAGQASDVVLVPGSGGALTAVAAFAGEGIFRATRSGGSWSSWTQSVDADLPPTYGRTLLGQCAATPNRLYALVVQTAADGFEGMFRSNDGGTSWSRMDVRLEERYEASDVSALGHSHTIADFPTADLLAAAAPHTYTTLPGGSPAHTHTLTFTTAQTRRIAGGAQLQVQTNPDATGHQHTFLVYSVAQAHYNLFLEVHPTNPDVIYAGASFLYRNTTGGGVFNRLTNQIHIDQHALAIDPTAADTKLWVGNDGGVFRSGDGGATWQSRNNGLATLEYWSGAVHPQWANIMLAGAQDNGLHRYTGNPVSREVHGWDIMQVAIDPTQPTRMYGMRQFQNGVMRSDHAGNPDTWLDTTPVPSGTAQFGNPFVLDPSGPGACFFGNTILWRSPNHGDSWTQLTAALPANIGAIAVHPTDPNTVYFCAGSHIYRLQRTGPSWSTGDVTLTEIGAPMVGAFAMSASSLAVEPGGAVWMTSAVILSGGSPHLFRWDGSSWTPRATGLPPSVPLNTIAIDPASPLRLFCGGSIGIFRSDDGGLSWTPWDNGLPNAFVQRLLIGPGRLIRAVTFGRGVWEREIDPPLLCPRVDLYVRDNIADSGRQTPSPEDVPHPLDPTLHVYHWQSPDIKVDAQEGAGDTFQTAAAVTDAVGLASILHRNPRRGRSNRFYAQVHNRGYGAANNVMVRAFFADAHGGLPPLPADFFTMGHPFAGTPSGGDWTAVGPTRTFAKVYPGQPAVAGWDFFVPAGANEHSCLLLVVTSDEVPLDGGGATSADDLVRASKLVALKNLHVVDLPETTPGSPDDAMLIELASSTTQPMASLTINWGTLPADAELRLSFELPEGRHPVIASDRQLADAGIKPLRDEQHFPKTRLTRCGRERRFDLDRVYALRGTQGRSTTLPDIVLPPRSSLGVQLAILLPKETARDESMTFDVIQRAGKRIVGGSTYVIRRGEATALEE